jgi:hypothetical protein
LSWADVHIFLVLRCLVDSQTALRLTLNTFIDNEKRKGTPQKGKDAYSSKAVSLYQFVEDD